jgi:bacterial/archaeal transporter family-2 protein
MRVEDDVNMNSPAKEQHPADLGLAFASGGILTLMVLFNGEVAHGTSPLFASWAVHGIGGLAALGVLAMRRRTRPSAGGAPVWAYLGGLSGAATVMLTSLSVNSALALSGTIALGLAGQAAFALAADRFGLFGLARRTVTLRDLGAVGLVLAGSGLVILARGT